MDNRVPLSSRLLDDAVNELASLPGIGKKTALRFALFLLKQDKSKVDTFLNSINRLKSDVKYCVVCNNISDTDICSICSDLRRDKSTICVVENLKDVISIELTEQYNGQYHVLGGKISPIEGIGPSDLNIDTLLQRIENKDNINEIILALSTTMEGDTTNFYIFKKLQKYNIKITTLARGVAVGDELEYTDEITLGRSIVNRTDFEKSFLPRI